MKRLSLYLIALLSAASLAAQVSLGFPHEETAQVGIYISDLATGRVLAECNSSTSMLPASTMKLVTTAAALTTVGGDFRFRTRVELCGHPAGQGTWAGHLVVRSAADPTLESGSFKDNRGFCDSIVANLNRMGINKITGRIVVFEDMYDAGPHPQWLIDDTSYCYGAGLFGFNFRDNSLNNSPAVDPSGVFEEEMLDKLRLAGIAVLDAESDDLPDSESLAVYTHESPASAEIFRNLMVHSDNLFAEGMLRTLAPDGTLKDAIKAEKELLADRGVASDFVRIEDGSGLSRRNYVSAKFLADVLASMSRSPDACVYASFFPQAGQDGTLKSFLAKRPVSGTMALKTGSMEGVQCYAGYRLDNNGAPTHVIVVLVNSFYCERAKVRESVEHLLQRLFPK